MAKNKNAFYDTKAKTFSVDDVENLFKMQDEANQKKKEDVNKETTDFNKGLKYSTLPALSDASKKKLNNSQTGVKKVENTQKNTTQTTAKTQQTAQKQTTAPANTQSLSTGRTFGKQQATASDKAYSGGRGTSKETQMQQLASKDKLTKEEKKTAKSAYKELKKYGIEQNTDNQRKKLQTAIDSGELSADYVKNVTDAYYKSSGEGSVAAGLAAFGQSFAKPIINTGAFLEKASGNKNGSWNNARNYEKEQYEEVTKAHPIAETAGMMAGETVKNVAAGSILGGTKVFSKVGEGLSKVPVLGKVGAEKLGEFAANQATDLVIDTLPNELMEGYVDDKSAGEIAKNAAINIGLNTGMNVATDILPTAVKGGYKRFKEFLKSKGVADEVAETVAKNVVENADNAKALDNINAEQSQIDDITETLIKNGEQNLPILNKVDDGVQANAMEDIIRNTEPIAPQTLIDNPTVNANQTLDEIINGGKGELTEDVAKNTTTSFIDKVPSDVQNDLTNILANSKMTDTQKKGIETAVNRYYETGELFNLSSAEKLAGKNGDTETTLFINDLINKQIDDVNSPYGKLGQTNGSPFDTPKADDFIEGDELDFFARENAKKEPTSVRVDKLKTDDTTYKGIRSQLDSAHKNVKFNSAEETNAFIDATNRMELAYEKVLDSKTDTEWVQNVSEFEKAYREARDIFRQGYVEEAIDTGKTKAKKEFREQTKGIVIKLTDELRNEEGLKDKSIPSLNSWINARIGREADNIRFSTTKGTSIDALPEIKELVDPTGETRGNEADYIKKLLDHIDGLSGTNVEKQRIPAEDLDILTDDIWDSISDDANAKFYGEKVLAEDIGLNPETDEAFDSVLDTAEEELLPSGNGNTDVGKSKVITNTAKNNELNRGFKKDELKQLKEYEVQHESTTFNDALERTASDDNMQKWENLYTSGKRNINDATDVDTAMLILHDLNNKMIEATDAGNTALASQYKVRKYELLNSLREFGTKKGQDIQAFAKWNRTAFGAEINAERIKLDQTNSWKSRNKKKFEQCNKLATALKEMGNDGTIKAAEKGPVTKEQMRQRVINTLSREFSGVEDKFDDNAIDYLTELAMDKNTEVWQITDEIEHYFKYGEFYTLDESTPIIREKSSKITKVLRDMGDDTRKNKAIKEVAPKDHYQVMAEIRNSLEDEMASVEFTDSDLDFLATLVEEKIPNWQIEDEIQHRLRTGEWYTLDESTKVTVPKSRELAGALSDIGNDSLKAKNAKEPVIKSHATIVEEVKNTLADEMSGIDFSDSDIDFIATMIEEKVPRWQIADEISHKLQNGIWYTLDESVGLPKPKQNAKLNKVFENLIEQEMPKVEAKQISRWDLMDQVRNTIDANYAEFSGMFDDNAIEHITDLMMDKNIKPEQLTSTIDNFLKTGEWENARDLYTNSTLSNAFRKLVEEARTEIDDPKFTLDEYKKHVRNTISNKDKELLKDFSDEDIDYLASLLYGGANSKEVSEALAAKMATGKFGVSDATQKRVAEIFDEISHYDYNSREYVELETEAYKLLADDVMGKSGFWDKFNAWRFMSMLGNPKTMTRNIIGNKMFGMVNGVSNNIAAAMEEGVDALTGGKIERTKAFINPVEDRDFIKAAAKDADASRFRQLSGTKYSDTSIKSDIERSKSVWDSNGMRKLENAISDGVNVKVAGKDITLGGLDDYKAAQKKYSTSLVGYLKANGMDSSIFEKEARLKSESLNRLLTIEEQATLNALEKARDYATKQAEYAVFHEDNEVANMLTKFISNGKHSDSAAARGLANIAEGILPFRKTPANILRSGLEYSPLTSQLNAIKKTGQMILDYGKDDVYKSAFSGKDIAKVKAADVIDAWAKSLTGTGLTALGAYLFDKGILRSSTNDEKWQDNLEGIQNYSLMFKLGGKEYTATIDFLAPAVMPLLMGAEIKRAWDNAGQPGDKFFDRLSNMATDWESMLNAAGNIASPLVETSMLSGLSDTMDTIANATRNSETAGSALAAGAMTGATSYLTQAVPTIMGQAARTIDNTRRSTYSDKTDAAQTFDKQLTKMENKIPFLSMRNDAYVDAYGRTQNNGIFDTTNNPLGYVGNAAYQMLSPTYIDQVEKTPGDKLARSIYNSEEAGVGKDSGVYADLKTNKKIDGVKLSKEDYAVYSKVYGDTNRRIRNAFASNEKYANLSDSTKQDILKKLDGFSDKVAEAKINPDFVTTDKAYKTYVENGGDILSALDYYVDTANKSEKQTAMETSAEAGYLDNAGLKLNDKNYQFAQTHSESDVKTYGEVYNSGTKMAQWLPALERKHLNRDLAYDIIMAQTGGEVAKAARTYKSDEYTDVKDRIVNYYYDKY